MTLLATLWRRYRGNERGTVVVIFALSLLPFVLGVGAAIDFARAYNVQTQMQTDLDSALIAAVKKVSSSDTATVQSTIAAWFAAQTDLTDYTFSSITVSKSAGSVTATLTSTVSTAFMQLIGVDSLPISVSSTALGSSTAYINVYIVLDNSASMMLAATTSDQKTMYNAIGCVFACHSGGSVTVNRVSYSNYYKYARAAGITLRTDVELDAAAAVVSAIETADSDSTHIKAGVYRIGATATLVQSPTTSMSTVTAALTESEAENYSYFNKSLPAIASAIGSSGDGSSASSPKKLILLVTDGVQSSLSWVGNSSSRPYITPINPSWCDSMKNTYGDTVGVLYTEYIASSYITSDSHYSGSLAKTMASSYWQSYWSGVYDSDITSSETRQAAIPTALEKCASSSEYFTAASSTDEIKSGLVSLFETYMQNVRLSQ